VAPDESETRQTDLLPPVHKSIESPRGAFVYPNLPGRI
jgi:hypothetical protein